MKNKRGFTLVEILSIIVVLGIMIVIVLPQVGNSTQSKKEKEYAKIEELIENAAKVYHSMNEDIYQINLETLVRERYITSSIKNPLNDSTMAGCIKIIMGDDGSYQYNYVDGCGMTDVPFSVDMSGGIPSQTFESSYKDGTVIELKEPTKLNSDFSHWEVVKGNSQIIKNKLIIGDTETILKAYFIAWPRLTVDPNEGVFTQQLEEKYKTGQSIILENPTRVGYTFSNWEKISGDGIVSGNKITIGSGDTVIRAKWIADTYNVTYNTGNYLYNMTNVSNVTSVNMTYSVNNGVVTVKANADDGFGHTHIKAYLEAGKEYIFNCDTSGVWGSAPGSDTVEALLMLNDGYELYYGMESNNNYKFTPTQSGVYYLRLDVNQNGKTHTFSNISITTTDTKTVTYNGKYDNIPTPTRHGYMFVGWFTGNAKYDPSKSYRDYPWLYYADAYPDLYNAFGYNETLLRNHYVGAVLNGTENRRNSEYVSTDTVEITEDTTVYAGWSPNTYSLTSTSGNYIYNMTNASNITSANMTYSVNNGVVTVKANADDGFGHTHIRAYLEAGKEYVFNCDTSGVWGSASGSDTVEALLLLNDEYNLYYGMGSNNNYKFTPAQTGIYYLRLDVNQNGKTHTFSNISITTSRNESVQYQTNVSLSTPYREGYTFNGWEKVSGDSELKGNTLTMGTDTVIRDKISINTYTVTLSNANATTQGSTSTIATYGAGISGITLPTRTNYSLLGWYTSASGGTLVIDENGRLLPNVSGYTDSRGNWIRNSGATLYAQWFQHKTFAASFTYGSYGTNRLPLYGNSRVVSGSTKLSTAINVVGAKHLEFDVYLESNQSSNLQAVKNYLASRRLDTQLEFSSGGKEDVNELAWGFDDIIKLISTTGTSHIKLPLNSATSNSGIDYSKVNFMRIYSNTAGNNMSEVIITFSNFKFT